MSATTAATEERIRWTATATLGATMAGHALLETARDALFLANLPVEQLPWVTIVVAALALWIVRVADSGANGASLRRRLVGTQALAAASILGFWIAMGFVGDWLFYGLYVWSAVISSACVVTFWLLLGDVFTITQGKKLFASIAIGGAFGALVGAAIATLLAPSLGPAGLLVAASVCFAAGAVGPASLRVESENDLYPAEPGDRSDGEGFREGIRQVFAHPYARRIAALVALASATFTLGDYLFKSVLAAEVPAADLSIWLARIYLGLNGLSIAMLALGVTPALRRLGVDRSLTVLPGLIAASILAIFVGPALFAIILLKLADGTLRYSLHKTATELLFLPMDTRLRNSVKGVIDLAGSSAAKALASFLILALVTTPEPRVAIAVTILVFAACWTLAALEIRGSYLDVFRRTLRRDSIETLIDHPELDVASIESLLRALSDRDELTVIAAMEILHERRRCGLIPSLILYHPSPLVVAKAVDLFASGGRDHVLDFADRLLEHEYACVRSAIVRAAAVLAPDREQLEGLLAESCPCIRVSAVAGLLAQDWIDPEIADREFQAAIAHAEPETRVAVANAAKLRYAPIYRRSLPRLARDPETRVAREAVRAIQMSEDSELTATLVSLHDEAQVRDLVRAALLDRGAPALEQLARALEDPATPVPVLRHIPRTISVFSTPEAASILLEALGTVRSGMVRYKILRALRPLLSGPLERTIDKARIVDELRGTVERCIFLLQHEVEISRGHAEEEARRTSGGRLLIDLVRDKRFLATERIFLLLALLYPDEDFRVIQGGIRSERATRRASGIELLEHVLPTEFRNPIIGIASPEAPEARLRVASPERANAPQEFGVALRALMEDTSEAVAAFAMYHAAEVDLGESGGPSIPTPSRVSALRERALQVIERLPEALARRVLPAEAPPVT